VIGDFCRVRDPQLADLRGRSQWDLRSVLAKCSEPARGPEMLETAAREALSELGLEEYFGSKGFGPTLILLCRGVAKQGGATVRSGNESSKPKS
jgi:hypothetical protein